MQYNQKKLIQVIIYEGDLEMLNFRLREHSQVDYFLIVESIFDKNGQMKPRLFSQTNLYRENINKFIHIDFHFDFTEIISEKLVSFCGNFEDIVIVSKEYEFADLTKLNEIEDRITEESFFLKHKNYWWGINLKEPEDRFGSMVFSFSQLLRNKNVIKTMVNLKNDSNFSAISLSNGWAFNFFFLRPGDFQYYVDRRLPYGVSEVRLITANNDEELPLNIDLLPKITEPPMKQKILIIIDNCFVPNNNEVFDRIININYVDIPKLSTDVNQFNFLLPTSSLYGIESYDKFIDDYKLNEINSVLTKICISGDDCIVVRFKDEMIVFNYSDVIKRPISTLKNPS